jgi:hypothetical protein
MLIRLTANAAIHAAAGVATGLLAVAAAEGWRRALKHRDAGPDGSRAEPGMGPSASSPETTTAPGAVGPEGPASDA